MKRRFTLCHVTILLSFILLSQMIPLSQASESTELKLTLTENYVIDLNSPHKDRMIRTYAEFVNFDLADRFFLMNIIQSSTGNIISSSQINVLSTADGVVDFDAFVLYRVNDQDICEDEKNDQNEQQDICYNVTTGDYKMQIMSKDRTITKSVSFSIIDTRAV